MLKIVDEVPFSQDKKTKEKFLLVLGALSARLISLRKVAEIMELEEATLLEIKECFMPKLLENKLSNLINEIKEIKKELILLEIKKKHGARHKLDKWKSLGEEISSKWNKISAAEEINAQREKSW